MAVEFKYKVANPGDFDLLVQEARAQAKLNFQAIKQRYMALQQAGDPKAAEFEAILRDKEALLSKVLDTLARKAEAKAGWQTLTETQARRIFRGLRTVDGRLLHPDMPGSQPPVAPRSGRPTSAGRPTSGGRPTSAPTSAGSIPTAEEALEIFRRLYPQFLAEMGGSNTERLYASHGRY